MSDMRIWIQDRSQLFKKMQGQGTIVIDVGMHADVSARDKQLFVPGLQELAPEDFTGTETSGAELLKREVVHSYAVARLVVNMYEALLIGDCAALSEGSGRLFPEAFSLQNELIWSWNHNSRVGGPLKLYLRAGIGLNAFYSQSNRAVRLQYFPSADIFACHSLDLVAHEVGHAVLDALKPGWWRASSYIQTSALHESFGDLTIIFLFLCNRTLIDCLYDDLKKAIERYSETDPNADLEDVLFELGLFVLNIGEELARARNALTDPDSSTLRDFRQQLRMSTVSDRNSAHSLSRVFTKAICLIIYNTFIVLSGEEEPRLVNSFVPPRDSSQGQEKLSFLRQTGELVACLLLAAIAKAPDKNVSFADVADEMCQQAEQWTSLPQGLTPRALHNLVKGEFENCEILGGEAAQRPQYSFPQWCSTQSEVHNRLTWPVRRLSKVGKPARYSRSRLPLSSL